MHENVDVDWRLLLDHSETWHVGLSIEGMKLNLEWSTTGYQDYGIRKTVIGPQYGTSKNVPNSAEKE